jgi:protein-tyrosine phosphatase
MTRNVTVIIRVIEFKAMGPNTTHCRASPAKRSALGFVCLLLAFDGAAAADRELESSAALSANATIAPVSRARALELSGAPNFRDIGGYVTVDGHSVRWNRVYRSSDLSHLTSTDAKKVGSLNIASVIDLRTDEERARSPRVWMRSPADIYQSPQKTLAPVMQVILHDAESADGARAGLIQFYARMPDRYRAEYSAMFQRIAAGELPILVHCTAGKDRTGVAIALLLTAIGVSRPVVVDDYALTEKLVPASAGAASAQGASAKLPEESRRVLWRADPKYILAALDSIEREYGSTNGYLARGLGLSKAQIVAVRAALVE